jgi:hypothetical protein
MKDKPTKGTKISRRGMLPLLGGSLLIPFLGFSNTVNDDVPSNEEDYETLLKPDGTVVKVKSKVIKESKVVSKNVSNTSMLKWLKKKF